MNVLAKTRLFGTLILLFQLFVFSGNEALGQQLLPIGRKKEPAAKQQASDATSPTPVMSKEAIPLEKPPLQQETSLNKSPEPTSGQLPRVLSPQLVQESPPAMRDPLLPKIVNEDRPQIADLPRIIVASEMQTSAGEPASNLPRIVVAPRPSAPVDNRPANSARAMLGPDRDRDQRLMQIISPAPRNYVETAHPQSFGQLVPATDQDLSAIASRIDIVAPLSRPAIGGPVAQPAGNVQWAAPTSNDISNDIDEESLPPIVSAKQATASNGALMPRLSAGATASTGIVETPKSYEPLPPIVSAANDTRSVEKNPMLAEPLIVKAPQRTPLQVPQLAPSLTTAPKSETAEVRIPTRAPFKESSPGVNFPNSDEQFAEFIRSNAEALEQLNRKTGHTASATKSSESDMVAGANSVSLLNPDAFPDHAPIQPVAVPDFVSGANAPASRVAQVQEFGTLSTPVPDPVVYPVQNPNQDVYGVPYDQQIVSGPEGYFDDSAMAEPLPSVGRVDECFGFTMHSRGYLRAQGLLWMRENAVVRAGNFSSAVNDFEYQPGIRLTLGRRTDSIVGWEASYTGFDPWVAVTSQADPAGGLVGAVLGTVLGSSVPFSAFGNSTFLEQYSKTDLHALEVSKTWWGWDVAKTYLGFRYMALDDEFRISSANTFGDVGVYTIDIDNRLLGVNVGSEVIYDYGRRVSLSLAGRMAAYGNFSENRTLLINAGTVPIFSTREKTELAADIQLGANLNFRLGRRARLTAGYELMKIWGVFTAADNYRPVLTGNGSTYQTSDAFLHGASIGIDFYR